ncbi:MAG: hypothetical protein FD144_2822 [Rhodospirillaceae bacterium]|nr:MAG: hypothetical protein FD144_2822 [Rhodospirillaceae bacterium]
MSDVGLSAGLVLQQIGTPREVAAFFELIGRHKPKSADHSLTLVTDRLYRRTVPGEAFDALLDQLHECQRTFRFVPITPGFWDEFNLGERSVGLDRSASSLADAFQRIFLAFDRSIEVARLDRKNLRYFRPIRLQALDGPRSYEHEYMPLEDFEEPDMRPIWLE